MKPVETMHEFKRKLLAGLSKFSDNHTLKQGIDEIRKVMAIDITDSERMNAFLLAISEQNEHWKAQQKKEYIKLFGVAAEIFEESLIPFLPKILSTLQKKLKDGTSQLHGAIGDTLGQMTQFIIEKVEEKEEKVQLLNTFMRVPFGLLEKSPNMTVQTGSAQTLSKIIQNSPEDILSQILDDLCSKILSIIKLTNFKANTPILECLISLVFHVESDFSTQVDKFMPQLIEYTQNSDWNTKKVAIDAIYSISAILKEEIQAYRVQIVQALNQCKFDKNKPVREATHETIKLIKETGPALDESQIGEAKKGSTRKSRDRGGSGSRSARPTKGELGEHSPIGMRNMKSPTNGSTNIRRGFRQSEPETEEEQPAAKKVSAATMKRRAAQQAQSPLREQAVNQTPITASSKARERTEEKSPTPSKSFKEFREKQKKEIKSKKESVATVSESNYTSNKTPDTSRIQEAQAKPQISAPQLSGTKKPEAQAKFRKPTQKFDEVDIVVLEPKNKKPAHNFSEEEENKHEETPEEEEEKTTETEQDIVWPSQKQESESSENEQQFKLQPKKDFQEMSFNAESNLKHRFKPSIPLEQQEVASCEASVLQTQESDKVAERYSHEGSYQEVRKDLEQTQQDVNLKLRSTANLEASTKNRYGEYHSSSYSSQIDQTQQQQQQQQQVDQRTAATMLPPQTNKEVFSYQQKQFQETNPSALTQPNFQPFSLSSSVNAPTVATTNQQDSSSLQVNQMQASMQMVMLSLEKMAKQQMQFQEQIMVFQEQTRNEITDLRGKLSSFEQNIFDIKMGLNQKIGGEEVRDIIDKKIYMLNEYKKDAEQLQSQDLNLMQNQYANQFQNTQKELQQRMEKVQMVQQLHNQLIQTSNTPNSVQPYPQSNQFEHSPSQMTEEAPSLQSSGPYSPTPMTEYTNQTQRNTLSQSHLPYDQSQPIAPYTPTSLQRTQRQEEKAAVGTAIQSTYEQIIQLLKEENKMKAYELMLQSDDDMLVIRILSKEKSFHFEHLLPDLRTKMLNKALQFMQSGEFLDILLPCLIEIVEKSNYKKLCTQQMRLSLHSNLQSLLSKKLVNEVQRCELSRIQELAL